jgi:hypothetical protein
MIWSDRDLEFHMECYVNLRDDIHSCEVTRIHENIESDPEEGFWWPVSYTYEFKILAYNELTLNYEVPVEDLTEQENFDLQKYINECVADEAAAAAEARYDR